MIQAFEDEEVYNPWEDIESRCGYRHAGASRHWLYRYGERPSLRAITYGYGIEDLYWEQLFSQAGEIGDFELEYEFD
jgi:hypothetical protein